MRLHHSLTAGGGAKINYSLHFIFFVATGATNYTGKFLSQGNCIVSNAVCWRAEVIDQPKKRMLRGIETVTKEYFGELSF